MEKRKALLALALAAVLPVAHAQTEKWPDKPVRIVVPFAPGGGTDLTARTLATKLSEEYGQQFIVENRVGAGGTVGAEFVARSRPDGLTFLLVSASYGASSNPALYKLPFDPIKDITPVSMVATLPLILAVHPSAKANNLKELIERARANPGGLAFGSGGIGGTLHLGMELLRQMTKTEMVHVPYKGVTLAINDLLAGRIQVMLSDVSALVPHMKTGKVRAIAVTTEQRISQMPEVPTVGEVVPGYLVNSWMGILGPAGIPRDIVSQLNQSLGRIIKRPDVQAPFRTYGNDPMHSTPEEFGRVIARDIAMWAKVVREGNIKVE